MKEDYKIKKIPNYWLLGKGYYNAYNAMVLLKNYITVFVKMVSMSFTSNSQALLARTLIGDVMYKEELFMVIFLHDV
jgi:hypothetical protein